MDATRSNPAAHSRARHDRFTIPLRRPEPLHFYINSLLVPHSRREMVWANVARASPAAGRAALPILGARAAQGLRGRVEAPAALDDLVRSTCATLREAGVIRASEASAIVLNDYGNSERGKTVFFIFEEGASRPGAIAKVSSTPEHRATLRREQATLGALRERLPPALIQTLPLPLGEAGEGASTAFAETYLRRASMYVEMRSSWSPRRQSHRHFHQALTWLAPFQRATLADEVALDDAVIDEFIDSPLAEYARRGAPSPAVRRMFKDSVRRARELKDEPLPLVARHGDYWARNLMLGGEDVGVIDWDGYKDRSPPFHDLFHFAVSYGLSYAWQIGGWADPSSAFRSTILANTWLSKLVRTQLRAYTQAMRVSPGLLQIFFPVYLAEQALSDVSKDSGTSRGRWARLLEDYAAASHGVFHDTETPGRDRVR